MTRFAPFALLALALTGCQTDAEPADDAGLAGSGLDIEMSDSHAEGVYDDGEHYVEFSADLIDGRVLDLQYELNSMLVTILLDTETGVIEYDGFSVDNGGETAMRDNDRAALMALGLALDELEDVTLPVKRLGGYAGLYGEFPPSLPMQGLSLAQEDRSYTSLCAYENMYVEASHDGWYTGGDCSWWGCDFGDDASTLWAYVSDHATQCGDAYDGTKTWTGSAWNDCYEYDHTTSYEYQFGNCFGNCGGGCQGNGRDFTLDCLNHDQCVRGGHGIAAPSCDDQFASTVDDEGFAPEC